MKFKIDENLPEESAGYFRSRGFDCHSVFDESISGFPDASIASVCQAEDRILITLDVDFANIMNYPPTDYPGIIVLRLRRQDKVSLMAFLPRVVDLLGREEIAGRLWIMDEGRTRIFGD